MKRLSGENGQTLIMVAVSLSIVLGFVAFATDLGVVLHQKRLAATAADSAAVAAAKYLNASSAVAIKAGQNAAAANGFTNGGGVTVTITPSPTSGAFTGSHYVRATVSQSVSTIFTSIFDISSFTAGATAVAGVFPSTGCVYVLNPSKTDSMYLSGSFDVSTPGCGVLVDSTDPNALYFNGGAGTLTSAYVNVVGGSNGHTGDSSPEPVTGVAPISDPLANLDLPQYAPTTCSGSGGTLTGNLSPGCWSGNVTLSNATLASGTYFFEGSVSLSGNVTGTGVTLYMTSTSSGLSATTNSTLALSARTDDPLTDPYSGIVMYVEPNSGSPSQQIEFEMGNATGSVGGIIYAPDAEFYIHDSGGDKNGGTTSTVAFNMDLVVGTFYDSTGDLSITSYTQTSPNSPLTKVTLVE